MAVHEIARRLIGGVWRTVDAEEDGGGNGGSQTPPVTFTGTDPDEAVLTVEADDAQTELVFRAYDKDGDLAVDIDKDGVMDARQVVVQTPPDTGDGAGTGTVRVESGAIRIIPDAAQVALTVEQADPSRIVLQLRPSGFGDLLEISPAEDDDVAIQIVASETPSVNILEVWDHGFNNVFFAITPTGGIQATLPTSNPGAGLLWNDGGTVKVGT